MFHRVIHRRQFEEKQFQLQNKLHFDTALDVFNVIKVDTYKGLPTVWYETLPNPVKRSNVTLKLVFDDECVPHSSTHVGSTMCSHGMVHIYQVFGRK